MAISLSAAMKLLEVGRYEPAADALLALAGPSGDGVIARFRAADALSRLGRHDEAVAAAQQAVADDGASPAPSVWLVQILAEAGRHDEAAAVALPDTTVEPLAFLSAGYAALGRIAAGERSEAEATKTAILDTLHSPLYSLALRVAESSRLASEPRWPDLPSTWYAIECVYEMNDRERKTPPEQRKLIHPSPPAVANPAHPGRGDIDRALGYLQEHVTCADHDDLVRVLRNAKKAPDDLDDVELESHLAHGRVDAAYELAERLAEEAGKKASGELCLLRTRVHQLRGEPRRPSEFAGAADATRRMRSMVDWLDLTAALMDGRAEDARPLADTLADPAHREFVEAALQRWAHPPGGGAAT